MVKKTLKMVFCQLLTPKGGELVTMFDLNSVNGFGFTTCYIGLVESSPSRGSQLHSGNVKRRNHTSVMLESTFYTSKKRLGSPISSVKIPTSWTGFGGVSWIYINYGYPSLKGFVLNKRLECCKSPAVEITILPPSMFSTVTDSRQFLHNDYITFFKTVYKLATGLVQNGVSPVFLLFTQPFQVAFSRLCAFGLEGRTELFKMLSLFENGFPFNPEAVGSNEKIIHSNIYPNGIVPFGFWNCSANCNMEEEGFVSVNQGCVCWLSVLKKLSLILTNIKRWFHSFLNSGNRSVYSIGFVDKSEKPFIQIHRKPIEFERFVLSLFVGFGNPISSSNGEICGEIEFLPCFSVNHVVECNGVEHSLFKGYSGNVITSILKSLNGGKQLLRILNGWLEFADNGFRKLHKKAYMQFQYLNIPQFLPPPKRVGFLEVI